MQHARWMSPLLVGVIVAIGCGSGPPAGAAKEGRAGKPQDASATADSRQQADPPIQVAEATAGGAPAAAGGSASIRGSVAFQGGAPAPAKIKMDADPVCKQQHATPVVSEEVAVNGNGTLKNVFVYVKEGAKGPFAAPTTPVTLDQKGCWYVPHVFGIQVNQPLDIVNSDPTLHNVNAKPAVNQPFNLAQPSDKGPKMTKKFTKPELAIPFKCNVHPWMKAYGHVLEHPFFSVSGGDGTFAITGLPAGTYVVEAWHEKYGTQTQTVSVSEGETASVEFTFTAQ